MVSAIEVIWGFEDNIKWFNSNCEQLKTQFNDEWVAVLNKSVVDHDPNLQAIVKRLREKHAVVYPQIAVEYVSAKDVELLLHIQNSGARL